MSQRAFNQVHAIYEKLGIGDRAVYALFEGPHEIHGVEAFQRHLREHQIGLKVGPRAHPNDVAVSNQDRLEQSTGEHVPSRRIIAARKQVESGGSPSRDGSPQGTAVPAVLGAGRVGREVSRQPE